MIELILEESVSSSSESSSRQASRKGSWDLEHVSIPPPAHHTSRGYCIDGLEFVLVSEGIRSESDTRSTAIDGGRNGEEKGTRQTTNCRTQKLFRHPNCRDSCTEKVRIIDETSS